MPLSPPSDSVSPTDAQPRAQAATTRQQKKRELDRRAQRLSRERTKARIAHLEQLVEEFRNKDTSGQVRALTGQLQAVTKQRDALTGLLRTLDFSIRQHITPQDGPAVNGPGEGSLARPLPATTVNANANANANRSRSIPCETIPVNLSAIVDERDAGSVHGTTIESLDAYHDASTFPELMFEPVHDPIAPLMDGFVQDIPDDTIVPPTNSGDPIVPAALPGCGCYHSHQLTPPSWNANLWRFANSVLTPSTQLDGYDTQLDDELRFDIPIRAIVEGWPAVEARLGKLPPSWKKLRPLDEVLFNTCGSVERLAILRLMHSLLMYHSEPSVERRAAIPPWYIQRPSQAIAHSYAINFFVWPGLRERFVFSQHRYCENLFWHLFAPSLRLLWPFEFRDAYTTNTQTGRFALSDTFDRRVRDINAWTMTNAIFDRWPELYGDIPAFPSLLSARGVDPPEDQVRRRRRRRGGRQGLPLGLEVEVRHGGEEDDVVEEDDSSMIRALGLIESCEMGLSGAAA